MVKDKYNQDENDFEDFEDFENFYGIKIDEEDEPSELDFNDPENKSFEDSSFDGEEETEETDI